MIKTTFATEVFIIANTKAIKLNDITNPPNNPAKPAFLIVLKASFLYIDNKNTETPKKKKNDLNSKVVFVSKYGETSSILANGFAEQLDYNNILSCKRYFY